MDGVWDHPKRGQPKIELQYGARAIKALRPAPSCSKNTNKFLLRTDSCPYQGSHAREPEDTSTSYLALESLLMQYDHCRPAIEDDPGSIRDLRGSAADERQAVAFATSGL